MSYPAPGNISRLTGTFTDINGNPADPTTITVQVHSPSGQVNMYTPTRDSIGVYHYDLLLNAPGVWLYRFIGTGAVTAQSGDREIDVPAPSF